MDFDSISPMLAAPVPLEKVDKYSDYYMEVKLDGVRCVAVKSNYVITLWTRQGNNITDKLPHIVAELDKIQGDWVLDGELGFLKYPEEPLPCYPEDLKLPHFIDFNATMRVIGSSAQLAIDKHKNYLVNGWAPMHFVIFDITYAQGRSVISTAHSARREMLIHMFNLYWFDNISLSYAWINWDPKIYAQVIGEGGEGVMLKNPNSVYLPGKRRANTWYKVKAFDTVDCMITDKEPGKGKYEGQIGALVAQDPTGRDVRISGMTDTMRKEMTDNFSDYVGKHVEVRYFGKVGLNQDGYRHPQFIRMRPDLD